MTVHSDTVATQSQRLVTSPVNDLIEFDFTSIGRSGKVYIAKDYEGTEVPQYNDGWYKTLDINWDGSGVVNFTRVDWVAGGFKNTSTGEPNEPTLTIAVETLWNVPGWASATSGMSLRDYQGLVVNRKRMFYGVWYRMIPQRYYVKSIESLTSTEIVFKLSGSFDSDNLNRPSARKLEK